MRDAGQYYYTRQGGNTRVDSISDRQDYKSVSAALRLLGFSPEKTDCIWRTIAAVLNLVSGQWAPCAGGQGWRRVLLWRVIPVIPSQFRKFGGRVLKMDEVARAARFWRI